MRCLYSQGRPPFSVNHLSGGPGAVSPVPNTGEAALRLNSTPCSLDCTELVGVRLTSSEAKRFSYEVRMPAESN